MVSCATVFYALGSGICAFLGQVVVPGENNEVGMKSLGAIGSLNAPKILENKSGLKFVSNDDT